MILSVGIIAMNEENYLPFVLDDILKQKYETSKIELILVDSVSTDTTKKIMCDFQTKYTKKFFNIIVLDNVKKIQSAGWNVVLKTFTGDAISRIDAHARLDKNFFKKVSKNLSKGIEVIGGPRYSKLEDDCNKFVKLVYNSEISILGSGVSKARRDTKVSTVDSVFHATYSRNVIDQSGLFNESLGRTEDNEYHYRIRKNGFKIYFDPEIISYQYVRPTIYTMVKQKFGNGLWIGRTVLYDFRIISWYHLAPFIFYLSLLTNVSLRDYRIFSLALQTQLLIYISLLILNSVLYIIMSKEIINVLLIIVIPLSHVSYAVGTLAGLLSYPLFSKRIKKGVPHDKS